MSELSELETMAEMVGFRYANCSIDTVTRKITLQCEDHDGQTLSVEADTLNDAMSAMMVKLGAMLQRDGQTWQE
jgi:hypothetical protein